MNNPFDNMFQDKLLKKQVEEFEKQNNKALRHKFGDLIKGKFLINIKSAVMALINGETGKYYDLRISHEKIFYNRFENIDYDICRHIVGVHRSNLIFETVEQRTKFENDENYKKALIDKVVSRIILRKYGSVFFRWYPILQGECFIWFPVPYYLFVLCTRSIELFHTDKCKNLPCYPIFHTIITKGLAALSLLEGNFLDNAYPICRGIIELYIKLLVLLNKPEAVSEYEKFAGYDLEKSCTSQVYSNEFNQKFSSRIHQGKGDKIDYLHYGWVDAISDYHSVIRTKPYSINGLIEYLRTLYTELYIENFYLTNLEKLYKMCHGYTHGNVSYSKYPILHYFEISIMLYVTISHTYKILCEALEQDEKIFEIDVLAELDEAYSKLEWQYDNRSTQNFDYYYENQFRI